MKTLKITDSHLGHFETISGKIVDLKNPTPDMVNIHDIATSLCNTVRFNGHITPAYTVAHHSIIMSYIVPQELALAALLHDATEAYLGDVVSPLKKLLGTVYTDLEKKWETAIHTRFHIELSNQERSILKYYDKIMLKHEYRTMRGIDGVWWWVEDRESETEWKIPLDVYQDLVKFDNAYTGRAFTQRFKETRNISHQ